MYDLFKIDIDKTLDANINGSTDRFVLVYKTDGNGIGETALKMFTDSSFAYPVPSQIIDQRLSTSNLTPAQQADNAYKYGIINFGTETVTDGAINFNDYYSVAPYLYSKYDTKENGGSTILTRNPLFNHGQKLHDKAIEKYNITIQKQCDDSTFSNTRKDNFLNQASATGEYLLNPSAAANPQIVDEVKKAGRFVLAEPKRNQPIGIALT